MSFPPELDGTVANFFELKFTNYDRQANLQKAKETPNSFTIFLPTPGNLSDTTDLNYEEYNSFGGLDKFLSDPTSGQQVASGALGAFALGVLKHASDWGTSSIVKAIPGINSAGNLGSRLTKVGTTQTGALVNPAPAVEFLGINRKTYDFSWRLIARSQNESILINNIVDCIRWNVSPERVMGDWVMTYPSIAFMKFHGNYNYGKPDAPRQIIQFAPTGAVVTSFNVTYNGSSGEQVFFEDSGEPVEVAISLRLADRGILTRNQIDESWKGR